MFRSTGDPIDGVRAEPGRTPDRLVDADELEAQTEAMVRQRSDNAPLSPRAMRVMLAASGSTSQAPDLERFDTERVAVFPRPPWFQANCCLDKN